MARIVSEKQINNFVKGVITEASPLTFPENSSIDESNFVLKRDGSRERRLGMDYELGYSLVDSGFNETSLSNSAIQFFQWDNAGSDKTLGIVRISGKLWFLDLEKANPSAHLMNGGVPLTVSGLQDSPLNFSLINNGVVLVSKDLNTPVYLEYTSSSDTVSQTPYSVEVRDLWGVEDGLAVEERPTTLSTKHKYNLRNQGWIPTIKNVCSASADPIDCTYTKISKYPSNADIWSFGKVADSSSKNYEKYDPVKMEKNSYDFTVTPKGKYILNVFSRGTSRETKSGLVGLPVDSESGRFSTSAVFASRVFYSGVNSLVTDGDNKSPNYSSYIFFSQIVRSKEELGKCYQEADPTSDTISDIVDTDGGTIQIPNASQILHLISTKTSLLVLASNGIWEIFAGESGFSATGYQINKVTDIGIKNTGSVVVTDGLVVYWSNGGIYLLQPDNVTGRFIPTNLSLTTIQTWFNSLPEASKSNALGFFDEKEHIIRWLYNEDDNYNGVYLKNRYNRELVFDLTLQAFYFTKIENLETDSPYVASFVSLPNFTTRVVEEDVVVGTGVVTVDGENVFVERSSQEPRGVSLKYLTVKPGTTYSFTVSEYKDTSFKDWAADGGKYFSSYLLTGQELFGDILRTKQIPYIVFYFKRTEDSFDALGELNNKSSCMVQSRWGWTDSINSGKWGTPFQAYRFKRNYVAVPSSTFDYGEDVIVSKSKLRGSGKSISLYISSENGKDMKILGWAMKMSGNSDV